MARKREEPGGKKPGLLGFFSGPNIVKTWGGMLRKGEADNRVILARAKSQKRAKFSKALRTELEWIRKNLLIERNMIAGKEKSLMPPFKSPEIVRLALEFKSEYYEPEIRREFFSYEPEPPQGSEARFFQISLLRRAFFETFYSEDHKKLIQKFEQIIEDDKKKTPLRINGVSHVQERMLDVLHSLIVAIDRNKIRDEQRAIRPLLVGLMNKLPHHSA